MFSCTTESWKFWTMLYTLFTFSDLPFCLDEDALDLDISSFISVMKLHMIEDISQFRTFELLKPFVCLKQLSRHSPHQD